MILIQFPEQQICLCLNTVSETRSTAKVKPLTPHWQAAWAGEGVCNFASGMLFSIMHLIIAEFPISLESL
jgi:hypothetical protein